MTTASNKPVCGPSRPVPKKMTWPAMVMRMAAPNAMGRLSMRAITAAASAPASSE